MWCWGQHPRRHYKFHQVIKNWTFNIIKNVDVIIFTYRLELLCDVEKTLRLARPVAAAVSALSRRACSAGACTVGGSLAPRPPSAGTTYRRLRALRTRVGAASSSSSSSSMTRSSRRRFSARAPEAEPCTVESPCADSTDAAPAWDGSLSIGLLPMTLSSVVVAG